MNAPRGDISTEQRWADDLLTTSRLYRQDAVDAGEQSVAAVLDELERSLLEIVNSPSKISAADLEQIRRRIDAAALLFKVRVMSDELRQREEAPDRSHPANINTENQLTDYERHDDSSSLFAAALALPVAAPDRRPPRSACRRCPRSRIAMRCAHPAAGASRADDRADDLYDRAREPIEEGKFDRAVDRFDRLIELKSNRTDAALYWKAYSLVEARAARRGADRARPICRSSSPTAAGSATPRRSKSKCGRRPARRSRRRRRTTRS